MTHRQATIELPGAFHFMMWPPQTVEHAAPISHIYIYLPGKGRREGRERREREGENTISHISIIKMHEYTEIPLISLTIDVKITTCT